MSGLLLPTPVSRARLSVAVGDQIHGYTKRALAGFGDGEWNARGGGFQDGVRGKLPTTRGGSGRKSCVSSIMSGDLSVIQGLQRVLLPNIPVYGSSALQYLMWRKAQAPGSCHWPGRAL